eukprot:CAMPEP_0206033428 /NCGR_PEP_ID=MMETSP1466-20131121/646_1 /ASSEMBLY_ACC=CAM_ASM_001126 /TAXON_ID=44452 /ORGANISM="Pavlova gyrans, Strain CCMP608" /LENGTH=54 /DNA_ID=CAMNT_0053407621 /DNA_START=237 /DNA_END=401 /DNA_ORIENTATION=-
MEAWRAIGDLGDYVLEVEHLLRGLHQSDKLRLAGASRATMGWRELRQETGPPAM